VGKKKPKFNDQPFAYHQEIELEIATLTNLGSGLGRVPLPDSPLASPDLQPSTLNSQPTQPRSGWVVMVPFTLPGERVRARVFRNHKNFSEADLIEVLTPSADRVKPQCPLFGRCGGCQYQHLGYAAQLEWKRRQVAELLKHMAGIPDFPVAQVVGSPREYHYRSKITPHFNPPRGPAPMPIGFLRQGTRFDILDVPHCPIATEAINVKLGAVREAVHAKQASYTRGATLLLRDAGGEVTTDYDAVITETIAASPSAVPDSQLSALNSQPGAAPSSAPLRLHFLARDFFQNNPFILPAFTRYVREQAAASGARFLVDAYCGSGLFSLSAASAFERVVGIEISESSVRFARENAAANDILNATFQAGDAAQIFAGLPTLATDESPGAFLPAETVVVIDPPRKGCDESFLQQLFAFHPRAVVYVSCDPATQMRDLVHFRAAGYELTAAQPFDLFPQTRHLECVLTLVAG
jgi:23S rRNA (uracil1939-C5)-methyltransferase/tRNA (uracil-5-)-methyltransferase